MDELGAVLQGDPEDGVEPRVDPTAQPVPGLEEHDLGAPGQGGRGREPRGASADHDHALHVRTPPASPGRKVRTAGAHRGTGTEMTRCARRARRGVASWHRGGIQLMEEPWVFRGKADALSQAR